MIWQAKLGMFCASYVLRVALIHTNKFPGKTWDVSNVDFSNFEGIAFIPEKAKHRRPLPTLVYQLGPKGQVWTVFESTRFVKM